MPQPPRLFREAQVEHAVEDCHVPARRDDIDMVGLDCGLVLRFVDRHRGVPLEDIREHACMAGVEVRDEHECHTAVGRHGLKEEFEGFQPAGRGTDPDDGVVRFRGMAGCFFPGRGFFLPDILLRAGFLLGFFHRLAPFGFVLRTYTGSPDLCNKSG